jgi:hypothetical protein
MLREDLPQRLLAYFKIDLVLGEGDPASSQEIKPEYAWKHHRHSLPPKKPNVKELDHSFQFAFMLNDNWENGMPINYCPTIIAHKSQFNAFQKALVSRPADPVYPILKPLQRPYIYSNAYCIVLK